MFLYQARYLLSYKDQSHDDLGHYVLPKIRGQYVNPYSRPHSFNTCVIHRDLSECTDRQVITRTGRQN